jgi:hypothetical protein
MSQSKYKILIALLLISSHHSCCTPPENYEEITGVYEIDKHTVRDATKTNLVHHYLQLKKDQTFKLGNVNREGDISGTWKITQSNKNKTRIIHFNFQNRQIQAKHRGTIFYFNYPNDFYSGYYNSVLYVKLNKTPEGF